MKHIKTKKTFESLTDKVKSFFTIPSRESIEDVKDICLELTDEGYVVDISDDYVICTIVIHGGVQLSEELPESKVFSYNDVEEVVERLQSYLGKRIRSNQFFPSDGYLGWINFRDAQGGIPPDYILTSIRGIKIKFKI